KAPAYISPQIPFIAIICARGISVIRFRVIQGIVVIVICCFTVNTYAETIIEKSLYSVDMTQLEHGKIWDMLEEYIVTNTLETTPGIDVYILGVRESIGLKGYLSLRKLQEGYRNIWLTQASTLRGPLDAINGFAETPLFIYMSYSEENSWPTETELWNTFNNIKFRDGNITLQHWKKIVDSKDSFNEVARIQATIRGTRLHVFLYENRERFKEKKI
ncbi:hypothetical protein ACFL3D_04470, partial [Candidatus Omnitrophota bacterium]